MSRHDVKQQTSSGGALTVREVLDLDSVRAGRPRVLSGEDALDRQVRWAHVSELSDIGGLLRGGELVLTTGIALPSEGAALERYVTELTAADVSGLIVELGRRFIRLPDRLLTAARRVGLPLIVLDREIRFVEVTEAIHTRIVDVQVRALRRSEVIHRRFTALTVDGAPLTAIVATAAELCARPVVLENVAHQVLAVAGEGTGNDRLFVDWEARSRGIRDGPTSVEVAAGVTWTVVPVAARGERWGRLIAVDTSGKGDADDTALVLERGAAALAVNRLSERDETAVTVRAHQQVLTPLLEGSYPSIEALDARARALGVPLAGRILVGVAVAFHGSERPHPGTERLQQDDVEWVAAAADGRLAALIDTVDGDHLRLLVSLPPSLDPSDMLTPFARQLREEVATGAPGLEVTIGIGSLVADIREARRTLAEADHVAAAAPHTDRKRPYVELLDVRLPGLIHVLRNDPRLQHFVERELSPLLEHDAAQRGDLIATLSAYLEAGRNKSHAAAELHLSRPALYARLRTIGTVLDADLDDVATCLSLHVALLALRSIRSHGALVEPQ